MYYSLYDLLNWDTPEENILLNSKKSWDVLNTVNMHQRVYLFDKYMLNKINWNKSFMLFCNYLSYLRLKYMYICMHICVA